MSESQFRTDILIVGAGPAGLAVADELQRAGYSVVLFDKGSVAEAISQYPTFMRFFSTKDLLEIGDFPLTIVDEKPSRRQYLAYLQRFVEERALDVRAHHEVTGIRRIPEGQAGEDDAFEVVARRRTLGEGEVRAQARYVVLATGAWDNPRKLGIEGEDLPKVSHRYREAHPYVGRRVLVVGGRNSAVEVALELYRAGALVDLSYRRPDFDGFGLKYWLKPDIENRLKNGEIGDHLSTVPVRFAPDRVRLRRIESGEEYEIPNDFVLCMTGYQPDLALLRRAGVEFDSESCKPVFEPSTYETNVPGLFVSGVMMQGNMSGHIFIENSREHGGVILSAIRNREKSGAPVSLTTA